MAKNIAETALKTRHTNKNNLVSAVEAYRGPLLELNGRKNIVISCNAIKGYMADFFNEQDINLFDIRCLTHLTQELKIARFTRRNNGIVEYRSDYMNFWLEEVVLFGNTTYLVLFKAHTRISLT